MERTKLGQIQRAEFGMGGYQGAQIGISFTLSGDSWGVGDFWGHWAIKRSEHAEWSESERRDSLGDTTMKIATLLKQAKKQSVSQLAGVPVEVTFEGMTLKSWRVLTEVL